MALHSKHACTRQLQEKPKDYDEHLLMVNYQKTRHRQENKPKNVPNNNNTGLQQGGM